MQKFVAGVALLLVLAGCQQSSREEFGVTEGSWTRTMMRGELRHGWRITHHKHGAQQWTLYLDDQLVADLIIQKSGYVSDACYETTGYYIERKGYRPGEPLGQHALDLLEQVQLEAKRRNVKLIAVQPHQLAGRPLEGVPAAFSAGPDS